MKTSEPLVTEYLFKNAPSYNLELSQSFRSCLRDRPIGSTLDNVVQDFLVRQTGY